MQSLSLLYILPLFMLPMVVVGWLLRRRYRRYHLEATEPFTLMPLRSPGEALRLQIEQLCEELDERAAQLVLVTVMAALMVLYTPAARRLATAVVLFLIVVGVCIYCARKLFRVQERLRRCRLGFMGERVVGDGLNQLMAVGYQVFHDVPFDGFNIDHVVVGPWGVFAVETKTRRKPRDMPAHIRAKVVFDGAVLHYPKNKTTHGLHQAEQNAETLSRWLSEATGEAVVAKPVLVLPGWFIDYQGRGVVKVINEKMIRRSFPSAGPHLLSPASVQRINYQLIRRCVLPKKAPLDEPTDSAS